MKFYEIDNALHEAILSADKPVRLRIDIVFGVGSTGSPTGCFETVFEEDIIEADFYSLKEAAGGVSSRGEVLLDNLSGVYSNFGVEAGTQINISFSIGEGLPYFQRFVFYVDEKGLQDIKGNGRKRFVRLGLQDLSYKLRKTDEARDWTSPAVFTYSVICDKSHPEKSLVHGITKRAGLNVSDIDCSTIPVTLPYVRLCKNIWAELSSLATAYRCHLETAPEKPLVFAHSPYQFNEQLAGSNEQCSYTFKGSDIFYLKKTERADLYKNTIRLKMNIPVSLEKQEIWRYDDPPVFYDNYLQPHYPFKYPLVREIEKENYEAKYRVTISNEQGTIVRPVVFADQIDTKKEAENRLVFSDRAFSYSQYDVTSHYDKAILKLSKENDGDLYKACIYGRPIVLDLNRSCFKRDDNEIAKYGTAALNVTGSYFSEYLTNNKPHYEDWVSRELAERMQDKREFTVKTHRALFNARVGAKVKIKLSDEETAGIINAFSFRYNRNKAFAATFRILAENTSKNQGV